MSMIGRPKKGFNVMAYNAQKHTRKSKHGPYATLEQMQDMEFGVTGIVRKINDETFELLIDDKRHGWAQCHMDGDDIMDWDYVSEREAKDLGLE